MEQARWWVYYFYMPCTSFPFLMCAKYHEILFVVFTLLTVVTSEMYHSYQTMLFIQWRAGTVEFLAFEKVIRRFLTEEVHFASWSVRDFFFMSLVLGHLLRLEIFFLWLSRGNLLLFIFQFSFLLCGECIRILMFHFAQFLLKFRLSINIVSDLIAMITRCGHFAQEFADGYSTISSEDWTLLGVVCLLFSHLYFWPTSFGERQQHGD